MLFACVVHTFGWFGLLIWNLILCW